MKVQFFWLYLIFLGMKVNISLLTQFFACYSNSLFVGYTFQKVGCRIILLDNAFQIHVALVLLISSNLIVFNWKFNFVMQIVNLHTNKVARITGKVENIVVS